MDVLGLYEIISHAVNMVKMGPKGIPEKQSLFVDTWSHLRKRWIIFSREAKSVMHICKILQRYLFV